MFNVSIRPGYYMVWQKCISGFNALVPLVMRKKKEKNVKQFVKQ